MRLDYDIVREILLTIERDHQGPGWELQIDNSDYPRFYAATKLRELNYIRAIMIPGTDDDEAIDIQEMTAMGHQFLDSVRDPTIWETTKSHAKKVGGFTIELLVAIAKEALTAKAKELGFIP